MKILCIKITVEDVNYIWTTAFVEKLQN